MGNDFAFRTRSSAQELRRYMHQMIYEFTQIEHLVGVNRTRYNQYESIMLPLINYLKEQGCKIILNRRVVDWEFKETAMQDEITVTGLKMINTKHKKKNMSSLMEILAYYLRMVRSLIQQHLATTKHPQRKIWITVLLLVCGKKASEKFYNLGNPDKFFADRDASEWVSFTLTTKKSCVAKRDHTYHDTRTR